MAVARFNGPKAHSPSACEKRERRQLGSVTTSLVALDAIPNATENTSVCKIVCAFIRRSISGGFVTTTPCAGH